MGRSVSRDRPGVPGAAEGDGVCPHFHAAIELVGKRWTGAILDALREGPMRFAVLGRAVPGLSDRLLSQRLRELEQEGLLQRFGGAPGGRSGSATSSPRKARS